MRPVNPSRFRHDCTFVSVLRRSPAPPHVTQVFHDCLLQVHGKKPAQDA